MADSLTEPDNFYNFSKTSMTMIGSSTSTSLFGNANDSDVDDVVDIIPTVIPSLCDRPRLVFDQRESIFVLAFCIPSIFVTVIMNLLVILALLVGQKTRNPQDWYIISMAAADLLTGLTAFPLHLYNVMRGCWDLPLWLCRVRHISSWWFVPLSEYMVAIIAFDRLLMIHYGASYKNRETQTRILLKIFMIWLCTGLATIPFNLMHLYDSAGVITPPGDCKAEFVRKGPLPLPYVLLFVCVILPALLCLVIYALIIFELRRRRMRERNRSQSRPASIMSSTTTTTSRQPSIVSTMMRHVPPSTTIRHRNSPATAVLIASVLPLITVNQNGQTTSGNAQNSTPRLSVENSSLLAPKNSSKRRQSADDLLASFSSNSSFTDHAQHHAAAASAEEVLETMSADENDNPVHHQSVVVALALKDEPTFSTAACAPVVVAKSTATIMSSSSQSMRYHIDKKRDTSRQRFRKAWRTMIAINGVFFGCWCPVVAGDLYLLLCLSRAAVAPLSCDTRLAFKIGGVLALALYINSMLNPLVYTIVMPNLRNRVLRIICPDWLPFSKIIKRSSGTERRTVSTNSTRKAGYAGGGTAIALQNQQVGAASYNSGAPVADRGASPRLLQHQHSGRNTTSSSDNTTSYYRNDSNEASSSQYHDELIGCLDNNGESVDETAVKQPTRKSLLATDAIVVPNGTHAAKRSSSFLTTTPKRKNQMRKERANSNRVVMMDSGVEMEMGGGASAVKRLKGGVVRVKSVLVHSTSARHKPSSKLSKPSPGLKEDGRGGIQNEEDDDEDDSSGYSL